MSERCTCNDAAFISKVAGYQALPQLLRLLARGEPVDLDDLVRMAGEPAIALARVLREQPGSEWDGNGRLVGFGLTARPPGHRFSVGGKTLYTWCATDTLFFTVILGEPTIAESTCPETGETIRVDMAPDGVTSAMPAGAVVSQLHVDAFLGNLRSDVCDYGHFFSSPSAATGWAATHPDGRVLSVADAFAECRVAYEQLGWVTTLGARR